MKKHNYLNSLRKKDGTFKRPTSISPIRYPGGKTRALGLITQYLPDDIPKKILSPFIGGASLEIAWANNLDVEEIVGCDVNFPLVNFWQVVLNRPNELANQLEQLLPTKKEYVRVKQLIVDWYKDPKNHPLDELDAAAYYFHNTQLSYGPMFPGYVAASYLTQKKWDSMITRVRNFRSPKLRVELCSFENSLDRYPNHFVYADPPYLLGYDSTVTFGMYPNRNWPTDHEGFKHELFRDKMINRPTEWIISYNNCETIKNWYPGYEFQYPSWQYSYQQGETRVNGVKGLRDNSKECKEILITNSLYTINDWG